MLSVTSDRRDDAQNAVNQRVRAEQQNQDSDGYRRPHKCQYAEEHRGQAPQGDDPPVPRKVMYGDHEGSSPYTRVCKESISHLEGV